MNIRETVFVDLDWFEVAQYKRPVTGFCEHGIEPMGTEKNWKFIDNLRDI
jgi:hypothetical protein